MCLVEAKLVRINVNKNGDEKKKKTSFQLRREGTNKNTNKHIGTDWNVNRQTCRFPSLTLLFPGETARGGQTLLDTLACFMVTYFKACMLFGDCRTWSTLCEMPENTGVRRRPCASPGLLRPGATRVCGDGEWGGKTRAEEQTSGGVKERRLIYGVIDTLSLICRRCFSVDRLHTGGLLDIGELLV